MGLPHQRTEKAYHLIYNRLITTDSFGRKIVQIRLLLIIIFFSIHFRLKEDLHFSGLLIADGFRVAVFAPGGAVQGSFDH